VGPVLPMLVPEDIGIEARNDQRGDRHATKVSSSAHRRGTPRLQLLTPGGLTRLLSCARVLDGLVLASKSSQTINYLRTSCANSVLLHGQPLAVESVILGTFENRALGAGKSSLERRAHSS
jgi:hypothetical protein